MSDDEDVVYVKKPKNIHYGSLEEQERARLVALAAARKENDDDDDSPKGGTELGDVHISNEYMDLEDEISKDKQALLEEFERRRKARQLNVSTDDDEVRRSLRQLGEPVCLFGEGPAERRVRLRDLLSSLGEDAIHKKMVEEEAAEEQRRGQEGTWYHEGSPQLREARLWIAKYSLPRAKERLKLARETTSNSRVAARQEMQRRLASATISRSQVGDTRPVSYCNFSDDSKMLVTSSWSGLCKVWSVPDCVLLQTLNGHNCNVGCIAFRPNAGLPDHFAERIKRDAEGSAKMDEDEGSRDGDGVITMASCANDGNVLLWSFDSSSPVATLDTRVSSQVAAQRVSRLAWHPAGRHLAAAVHDSSWRLWDIEKQLELLHQEGHSKGVHCVSFQMDGSLVATGGMDSFGRVWDVRTGRCVMFLVGHLQPVLGVDWSPQGHHIATASADNTAKIWDIRKRTKLYTIPAHTNLLSGVRYHPTGGHFLVTSSYDQSARVWSNPSWQPLKTLLGHDNKVMGVDITHDGKYIATCSYDRTFKLWAPEVL